MGTRLEVLCNVAIDCTIITSVFHSPLKWSLELRGRSQALTSQVESGIKGKITGDFHGT